MNLMHLNKNTVRLGGVFYIIGGKAALFLDVVCCNGGFCGFVFCARRKTAGFNRIFLDNFDNGGYTGSAFRVSKESAKIYRKPELFTDL